MARISGVDLPRDKRVEVGLTYIFGIGLKTAQATLKATGVNPDTRVKDLTEQEGVTIVMTTHDTSLMEVGDAVYELEDGEVIHGSV